MLTEQVERPATEVAAKIGLSRERVVRLVQRGQLRGRLLAGRFWLVDLGDAERWKAEQAQPATVN